MKIVVIGGSGLIGSRVVQRSTAAGHEALPASPRTGIDATTGRGLAAALAGAEVVVDVSNSPSFEDAAVLAFFERSGRNLARAEREAGVRHHVALSIVGLERVPESGYFRAKLAQEALIERAGIPYTVVRATQFFEFLGAIAGACTVAGCVRVSTAAFQPMAADDVARAVADAALAAPGNGTIDVAGPERLPMSEIVARYLQAMRDPRAVVPDPEARYFGARLDDRSLVPLADARLGTIHLADWIRTQPVPAGATSA